MPHELVQLGHAPVLAGGHHGHDLLGEHVERVSRHRGVLDLAVAHPAGDHGALEQVGAELGEDAALRDVAHVVPRPPDPLEPRRDRLGRLHLDHEVDRAHVDAQLERRGGDQAGQLAGLEQVLHDQALLAREGAVVGPGDLGAAAVLVGRQLVQADGQALGGPAGVHEDDRGAVLPDQLQQLGVDGGPDRAAGGRLLVAGSHPDQVAAARRGALAADGRVGHVVRAGLAHVLDRHVDLQVERLADPGVDHPAVAPGAHEEAAHLLERPLGGRQADALHGALGLMLEALERERQMGAALGARHRVDLVDDAPLDGSQRLPRARGEHQVERLGRGDEHVGRRAEHRLALLLGRVAGPDRDGDLAADPLERRAQVLLHVVGERLERRDVHEPRLLLLPCGRGSGDQAVEAPQEGGERLPRAGGGGDQHVLSAGDGRPGLGLGLGGARERAAEPVADRGGEGCERVGRHRRFRLQRRPPRPERCEAG